MMEDEDEGGEDAMRAKATVFAAAMALARPGSSGSSRSGGSGSGSTTPPSPRSPMHDPMMMAPPASLLIASGSGGGGIRSKRTSTGGVDTSMILDDFPGDAEHAWERLGQSSVGLVEMLQPMQSSARAAGWTQQLLDAAAAAGGVQAMEVAGGAKRRGGSGQEGAAELAMVRQQELLLQSVGLRLLLATMDAQH